MDSPGPSDEIEAAYTDGRCYVMAWALHARFGWPIIGKVERWRDGGEYLAHAWVIHPSGQAFDVMGFAPPAAMATTWGSPAGEPRQFEGDDFLAFCDIDDEDETDTFWDDVVEAEAVIDSYLVPRYLSHGMSDDGPGEAAPGPRL